MPVVDEGVVISRVEGRAVSGPVLMDSLSE